MWRGLIMILTLCGSVAQAGTLYRWTDAQGKVHLSDKPPPAGVKQIDERETSAPVVGDDLPYATRMAAQRFPVVLYMNSCGEPCGKARAYLIKRGIPYSMKNPETDQMVRDELQKRAGALTVPTLAVGNQISKGFEEGQWGSLLDAAGYPRNAGAKPPKTPAAASGTAAQ